MIITISGTPGSGKSTVAKILVEKLNAERIYVGGIWREFFREKKLSLDQLEDYTREHPEADREVDEKASAEARRLEKQGKIVVVEGRTQFHFLPESIKIYIKVHPEEGARRIWKDLQSAETRQQRNEGALSSQQETKQRTQQREEEDALRYQKIYHLDYRDEANYDLVVDSTTINADETTQKILLYLAKVEKKLNPANFK